MPDKKKPVKVEEINPQVKEAKIGVRTLRKIPIYPLAVADQLDLTDIITDAIGVYFSLAAEGKAEGGTPTEFVVFVIGLIKENFADIVTNVTGEADSDAILREMTNDQLATIIEIVYKENYEGPLKKTVDLFQREDEETLTESILAKLQSPSVGPTEDTGSNTSSEEVTGKEESP